jgi:hypothetical protein
MIVNVEVGDIVEFKGGHRGIYMGKFVMSRNLIFGIDKIDKVYEVTESMTFEDMLTTKSGLRLRWQRSPETDWSKVPQDAKVLYRDDERQSWQCGHFYATNNSGRPTVYYGGRDSFTCFSGSTIGVAMQHMYVKLAEDVSTC